MQRAKKPLQELYHKKKILEGPIPSLLREQEQLNIVSDEDIENLRSQIVDSRRLPGVVDLREDLAQKISDRERYRDISQQIEDLGPSYNELQMAEVDGQISGLEQEVNTISARGGLVDDKRAELIALDARREEYVQQKAQFDESMVKLDEEISNLESRFTYVQDPNNPERGNFKFMGFTPISPDSNITQITRDQIREKLEAYREANPELEITDEALEHNINLNLGKHWDTVDAVRLEAYIDRNQKLKDLKRVYQDLKLTSMQGDVVTFDELANSFKEGYEALPDVFMRMPDVLKLEGEEPRVGQNVDNLIESVRDLSYKTSPIYGPVNRRLTELGDRVEATNRVITDANTNYETSNKTLEETIIPGIKENNDHYEALSAKTSSSSFLTRIGVLAVGAVAAIALVVGVMGYDGNENGDITSGSNGTNDNGSVLVGADSNNTPEPTFVAPTIIPTQVPGAVPIPSETETPLPDPTATPNPTATPVLTATPKPTSTYVPAAVTEATPIPDPTATPNPTATPVLTATPKPTSTYVPAAVTEATPIPDPTAIPTPTATPLPVPPAEHSTISLTNYLENFVKAERPKIMIYNVPEQGRYEIRLLELGPNGEKLSDVKFLGSSPEFTQNFANILGDFPLDRVLIPYDDNPQTYELHTNADRTHINKTDRHTNFKTTNSEFIKSKILGNLDLVVETITVEGNYNRMPISGS